MYKCLKCKKEFKFDSELNRHKNRKTQCNKLNNYNCNICKKEFKYESKLNEHGKTKKHKSNLQIHINGNQNNVNAHIGDNINNIQNIINLTLQTKPFNETDLGYLRKWIIEDIGNDLYIKTMDKDYLSIQDKVKSLFRGTIEILEHLHFNLNNEDNHNCKILLMFPGFKRPIYEYLILEIETSTNNISWKSLSYK
jgi:DNA-directed RNA polymerase subunit RPC12/RpoP